MTARRIVSIWLPQFSMERWMVRQGRGRSAPHPDLTLALIADGPKGPVIHATNEAARNAGVRTGARAVDMRALCPSLNLEKADPAGDAMAMQKLALGVVLTSQGVPFLHGGSDFARTKQGEHNSYNLGDEINALDWQRKAEFADLNAYVAGLIKLRREHAAFRMASAEQVREHLTVLAEQPVIAYRLDGDAVGDAWSEIVVAFNGTDQPQTWTLPEGQWSQVADGEVAGVETLREVDGDVELPTYSVAVFWRE